MMKKSPIQPKYEASYYDAYGFDLQEDFSQFLEEARNHEKEAKLKSSSVHPEGGSKEGPQKEKKEKKFSWRSSLKFSWWKADKKSKLRVEPTNNSHQPKISGKKQGHVSGPIYNCGNKGPNGKQWRPISGPLTNFFFKPTKREENEVLYVSLNHPQNSPQAVQKYGPLYTVT